MILTMFRTTPALSAKKRKAKRNITSDVCLIFIYKEEDCQWVHLKSRLMKWIWSLKTTTKTTIATRSVVKFEDGYSVETVFDGSKLGIEPYAVEVLPNGELLVLDYENSNIYKISSSLSLCGHAPSLIRHHLVPICDRSFIRKTETTLPGSCKLMPD
ncbi:uncharacterized protein LOC106370843 isoform X2 [Brassica napus]|uniref:uncharacterized protein LOC106370843 isoform X2 n=1 Tax=Brassica napus TaxID=3708 RepID=UPI002078B8F1|nr:uncharacterized protein LOC106370843 isoform X2 [Brassica napus]